MAVSELKDVIIFLQSHLIVNLHSSARAEKSGTSNWLLRLGSNRRQSDVDTGKLVEISDSARLNSIRVMGALSQRLRPVPRSLTASTETTSRTPTRRKKVYRRPASFFCEGALVLQMNKHFSADQICTSTDVCSYCDGKLWSGFYAKEILPSWDFNERFVVKSHLPAGPSSTVAVDLGCIFCDSSEVFGYTDDLAKHL